MYQCVHTVEDSQRHQKKKMIYYTFGLVWDRERLKFACDQSLNHQNLTGCSPAKQDLIMKVAKNLANRQKNR
jgi:hypothetical protein